MDYLSSKDITKDMKKFNLYRHIPRPAFTMIELIMSIVVLGILAAIALPRLEISHKQDAADAILSNIRYTQHLALMDYKHKFDDPKWQQRFWKIMFATCANGDYFYRIGSDDDADSAGTFEKKEAAIDPLNGLPLYLANNDINCDTDTSVSKEIFLTKKFGITNISAANCNNLFHIGFDHLGRPHQGYGNSVSPDYSSYMNTTCTYRFTMSDGDTFDISIVPETGYAQIVGQDGS